LAYFTEHALTTHVSTHNHSSTPLLTNVSHATSISLATLSACVSPATFSGTASAGGVVPPPRYLWFRHPDFFVVVATATAYSHHRFLFFLCSGDCFASSSPLRFRPQNPMAASPTEIATAFLRSISSLFCYNDVSRGWGYARDLHENPEGHNSTGLPSSPRVARAEGRTAVL